MAYDAARDRVVLFSGASGGVLQTSTWEFNGSAWSFSTPVVSPSPRAGHAMAYDEVNQKTILFSGLSAAGYQTSTWQWNGSTWTFTTPNPSPAPRANHALVFERGRGRVLLFGGGDASTLYADTWEWNTATGAWTNITPIDPPIPPARYAHAFAWDSVRQRAVLFGGYGASGALTDTWEFDPVARVWTQFDAPGPGELASVTMQFDPLSARCVLVGGFAAGQYANTIWEWNGVSWTHDTTGSDGRAFPASVYDVAHERIFIFGGMAGDPNGIRFEVTAAAGLPRTPWRLVNVNGPGQRRYHTMSADPAHSKVVLFGGLNGATALTGDTWTWNGASWSLASATGPSPRYGAALAQDPAGGGVILFGGDTTIGPNGLVGDTWRWDGASWSLLSPATSPPARGFHTLTFDPVRNVVVLFGGQIDSATFNDTWEWDGADWTQAFPAHAPPPRALASMAFDARAGRTLLYGGYTLPLVLYADVWAWDGADWSDVGPPSTPIARYAPALAYDAGRDLPLLFGGQTSSATRSDTFEWTEEYFRLLTSSAPLERVHMASATDPVRGNALIHGGINNGTGGVYLDTWATRPASPAIVETPQGVDGATGASVAFVARSAGTTPLTFAWRQDGVTLSDDGSHVFGSDTGVLVLNSITAADAGVYDVVVANACGTTISPGATLTVSTPCPADITGDGAVTSADLAQLLGAWGQTGPVPADLSGDGIVNSADLALLLGAWGPCP